jgi:hypothetical protein
LTQRVIGASKEDSMKRAVHRLEKFHGDMHCPEGFLRRLNLFRFLRP